MFAACQTYPSSSISVFSTLTKTNLYFSARVAWKVSVWLELILISHCFRYGVGAGRSITALVMAGSCQLGVANGDARRASSARW